MTSQQRVTAAVMIIGDEILSGRTQDVNLAAIARYIGTHGVDLAEARVVPDDEDEIVEALNHLRAKYDYVITTGASARRTMTLRPTAWPGPSACRCTSIPRSSP